MTTNDLTSQDDGDLKPGDLREQLKDRDTKISERDATIRSQAFQLAGVDPTKGIGKAIAASYEGDLTAQAIKDYAKSEFEVELKTVAPTTDAPVITEDGDDPDAATVAAKQAEADKIAAQGAPITDETPDQRIARHETDGNWDAAIDEKLDKLNPVT